MTLAEWLEHIPAGQQIKIGAQYGSGFVYCGPAGRCNLTQIEKNSFKYKPPGRTKYSPDGKALATRSIVSSYPSTVDTTWIGIFEGATVGGYWTKEEYEKGQRNGAEYASYMDTRRKNGRSKAGKRSN